MAYVPISQELHGDKRWVRHPSMLFAKADTVAPLLVGDLSAALHSLPIAFMKHENRFILVVMMGLRPAENLLVSAKGEWLSEYMPAIYRSSPFQLLPIQGQGHHALAIDEACLTSSNEGESIFDVSGEVTESTREILERVQRINATNQLTQQICDVLAEHAVLKTWPITLDDGRNKQEVNGLYCIDEEALNALSDDAFSVLRHANALPVIYAQLYSMQKLSFLARMAEQRQTYAKEEAANETFSFAGL